MNKHFEDARYYARRALETATEGVKEELEPLEERVRDITGKEKEPEPSRIEKLQEELKELEEKAEGEAREAIEETRGKLQAYRDSK